MVGTFDEEAADDFSPGHRIVWTKLQVSSTAARREDRVRAKRLTAAQSSSIEVKGIFAGVFGRERSDLDDSGDRICPPHDDGARRGELALRTCWLGPQAIDDARALHKPAKGERRPDS